MSLSEDQEIQDSESEETFEELEARAKAFLERCAKIKKALGELNEFF